MGGPNTGTFARLSWMELYTISVSTYGDVPCNYGQLKYLLSNGCLFDVLGENMPTDVGLRPGDWTHGRSWYEMSSFLRSFWFEGVSSLEGRNCRQLVLGEVPPLLIEGSSLSKSCWELSCAQRRAPEKKTPFSRDQRVKIFRMQSLLRSINQTAKGMATRVPAVARRKELLVQPPRLLLRRTSTQQPHECLKDFGVPNSSWSPEMMDQFQKFTKMSEDGSWQRIPSYNNCVDSMPAHSKSGYSPRKQKEACLFVRNVAAEGRGFEFAMFYNGAERRMVVLLQPGSYLEGMIGFVHGGAVAAILDHTFASCGIYAFGIVVTASLSVNFKSPIPLGSVVLVETKVEKVDEKKIFLSGLVRSTDTQTLHAGATALLIHLDAKTSSHPVTTSS